MSALESSGLRGREEKCSQRKGIPSPRTSHGMHCGAETYLSDGDLALGLARVGAEALNLLDDVHAVDDLTEDNLCIMTSQSVTQIEH